MEGMGKRIACAASIRGGNWNNGSNAGVFALNLNNAPSNSNNNIGFRCAEYSFAGLSKKAALARVFSCLSSCGKVRKERAAKTTESALSVPMRDTQGQT